MFETAELHRRLAKATYEQLVPTLRSNLLRVQNELYQTKKFPVIVIIGGVDGAGKGETVNTLHEWMDPRYLETHAFGPRSEEERERPAFWRFWRTLPPKGTMGIFLARGTGVPSSSACMATCGRRIRGGSPAHQHL